jgi:hypothetical protein
MADDGTHEVVYRPDAGCPGVEPAADRPHEARPNHEPSPGGLAQDEDVEERVFGPATRGSG